MDVVVGRVAKAHGITGELAIDVRTDSPELRFALGQKIQAKLRDGTSRSLTVSAARPHAGRLLVRFEEVVTRDVAESLRGTLLLGSTDDLPPTGDPDEFYDHELEGLTAELVDGTKIGTVKEILHGPGGELLVVIRDSGEALIPFVREIVPTVDVRGGRVVIDPPEGLLDAD
ncbi:16S rRNA processing protein RimM [Lentzea waywayandensis]|uniref:Ribosome maturation factor RimM n=2 Tax=Lentzea TaxID=165301 RepID=A0A1I6E6T7_9PSEU|nr:MULTISPECIES: ribosome maturation factor RimM [Lentzea]MDX8145420.1 ribosome maturation factor RimM [Lentzea sp. BCCO 10_0061]SFR13218.1 16S rRNA processing protein RimM [Lentzea waywayandensis]